MADKRKPRGAALNRSDEEIDAMPEVAATETLADEAIADADDLVPEFAALLSASDYESA